MSRSAGLEAPSWNKWCSAMILGVLTLSWTAPSALAKELRIVTIASAPFGFLDQAGTPSGMMYEISNLIAAEAGFTYTNQITPYPRTALAVARGDADFVLRYGSAELSTGAIQVARILSLPTIVVGKPSSRFRTLSDLHHKLVGTPRGGRFDEAFDDDEAIKKYPVSDYSQMLRMLLSDRLDAALGSSVGLFYNAQLLGIKKEQLGQPLVLSTQTFELHFSKTTADEETIAALKSAVARLKSRHAIKKIIDKYVSTFDWDLKPN